MNLDAEIAAAREHVARSIGQRARWAMVAIRERVERERAELERSLRPGFSAWLRQRNPYFDPFFKGDQ